jgi:hypothetical protein
MVKSEDKGNLLNNPVKSSRLLFRNKLIFNFSEIEKPDKKDTARSRPSNFNLNGMDVDNILQHTISAGHVNNFSLSLNINSLNNQEKQDESEEKK